MRTLPVLCVAFSLILASLQADAKRYNLHQRHLAQQKNDPNLHASDTKDQSQPPTSNNNEAKHDEDDDANESYGKFGHDSSESDSHHYFVDDQFHPH
ncbi:hypothetical protein L3X38_002083 [Prunus dulcis]|uniref:Uncharacterized protein n=1 Tax=Prunus dulcis TaxID=3755 RepID=A0AAD4WTW1_PRUDU|nr:hypothetical protein L3X38_002083 [Prunus dulcis]